MATSCEKFTQILEAISKEHKIDMQDLLGSLESKGFLPKKMMTIKTSASKDKGPYDNKRAKEFAEANGICIKGVVGTGRDGRITITDMKKGANVPISGKMKISDAATKLATENGIDISTITPSGKRGDILLKDVKRAIQEQPTQPVVVEEEEPELELEEQPTQPVVVEEEEPELELEEQDDKTEEDKLFGSDEEEEPELELDD